MSGRVTYEVEEASGIAVVTLDRPDVRNAIDPETIDDLTAALAAAEADDQVRVVLLTANGKDFCAGADLVHLGELLDAPEDVLLEDARRLGRLFIRMRHHPKPIVAAVHGNALAGGCGLATACDIVLAADDAYFGYPEVHLAFVPAMVMTMLVRIVGEKRAFGLVALGNRIDATEALEAGLVHCVYSRHTFPDDARAFAIDLAKRAPSAVALSKRLLYELDELTFEEGIERGAEVNAQARRTEACRESIRAFLDGLRPLGEPDVPTTGSGA